MTTTDTILAIRKSPVYLICISVFLVMSQVQAFSQTITTNHGLEFGTFYPTGTGGTIIVTIAGLRSPTGNVVVFPSPPATEASFDFDPAGHTGGVTLTIPSRNIMITRVGGTQTMSVRLTKPSPESFNVSSTTKNTHKTISVGGTLTVKAIATNPAGSYSGSFNVTFNMH